MQMKISPTLFIGLLLISSVGAQTRRRAAPPPKPTVSIQTATTKDGKTVLLKSDGTWEYTSDPVAEPKPEPTPEPVAAATPELASLSIEAAIVYSMGGAQPVARTDFLLLDESLPKILREAGLNVGDLDAEHTRESRRKFPTMPDFSKMSPAKADTDENLVTDFALASKFPSLGDGQFLTKARDGIRKHTVTTGTTDFGGKLQMKDVQPGNYFIVAYAETRRGYAIWNLAVSLKAGLNSILLDQRNAATAL